MSDQDDSRKNRVVDDTVLLSLVVVLPAALIYWFFFLGTTTHELTYCGQIKSIWIDFNSPNVHGLHSKEYEKWATSLSLGSRNASLACVDNPNDSMVMSCDGLKNTKVMTGKWELLNDGLYTEPHGLQGAFSSPMHYVALKQEGEVVYFPLFEFEDIYPPLEGGLINDRLAHAREVLCLTRPQWYKTFFE